MTVEPLVYLLVPLVLLALVFLPALVYAFRNPLRLHFVIVEAKTGKPVPNITIYGVANVPKSSLHRTYGGDYVSLPTREYDSIHKKIGVTNELGEFTGEYVFAGYGMLVFDLLREGGIQNYILCRELRLDTPSSPKKIIEVSADGRMNIKNPNKPEWLRIQNLR